MLSLQRTVGNSAVAAALRSGGTFSRLIGDQTATTGNPEARASDAGRADAAPAAACDRAAEIEADRVADAAVEHLGPVGAATPAIQRASLSPQLRSALAAVAPDLRSRPQTEVRVDETARRRTDALGARAFSEEGTISVHPGELGDRREANRLLAHEAVHAERHPNPIGVDGRPLVHAKLRGTRDALINEGGRPSSGRLRQLVGRLTYWDQILAGVGAYEEMEQALLRSGNPGPEQLQAVKPRLVTLLARIEAACLAWQEANGESKAARQAEEARRDASEKMVGQLEGTSDVRYKAPRRQKVAMLLPRVRNEVEDLKSGRWAQGLGLSDQKLTGEGRRDAGAINTVKELHYVTESGEFSGFFKSEKGYHDNVMPDEAKFGVSPMDPNYGGRSLASYRIDQLLDANVTAKVEFAVHGGKLGSVIQSVNAPKNSERQWSQGGPQKAGTVNADDPVLQRALNKLQILDAICGQLDRHTGNWFVDTDEKTGQVRGVTGIDLDMAFGSKLEGINKSDASGSPFFRGMPSIVDAEFGQRILQIQAQEIRAALRGLLSQAEIDATVTRFTRVKEKVQELANNGQLTAHWDAATAAGGRTRDQAGEMSYHSEISVRVVETTFKEVRAKVEAAAMSGEDRFAELPPETQQAISKSIIVLLNGYGAQQSMLEAPLMAGTLPGEHAVDVALAVVHGVLSDQRTMDSAAVAVQEISDASGAAVAVRRILAPVVAQLLQAQLARFDRVGARA